MSRKLFVGNLPYSVTSERLQEAFSQFGTVTSSKVIVDRETGRSRGFAFLEMETDDMGAAAMQAMNGALLDGRSIAVREAVERQPGGGGGGGFGGGGGAMAVASVRAVRVRPMAVVAAAVDTAAAVAVAIAAAAVVVVMAVAAVAVAIAAPPWGGARWWWRRRSDARPACRLLRWSAAARRPAAASMAAVRRSRPPAAAARRRSAAARARLRAAQAWLRRRPVRRYRDSALSAAMNTNAGGILRRFSLCARGAILAGTRAEADMKRRTALVGSLAALASGGAGERRHAGRSAAGARRRRVALDRRGRGRAAAPRLRRGADQRSGDRRHPVGRAQAHRALLHRMGRHALPDRGDRLVSDRQRRRRAALRRQARRGAAHLAELDRGRRRARLRRASASRIRASAPGAA